MTNCMIYKISCFSSVFGVSIAFAEWLMSFVLMLSIVALLYLYLESKNK